MIRFSGHPSVPFHPLIWGWSHSILLTEVCIIEKQTNSFAKFVKIPPLGSLTRLIDKLNKFTVKSE